MANDVEVKIGGNTTELESAVQNSGKVVQDALAKISSGFAKIQNDFAHGFNLDTSSTEEALKRSKQVFDDTRTNLEKYYSKLNDLNALHRVGAIDADTHERALKKLGDPPTGLLVKLKEGVDGVKAAFDKLNPVVEIFNAGMKIGEKLKQAADGVKDMDTEARKMGNALGISADEAHVLNTALGSVFQDKATYISAASTLSQNIHKNGDAFKRLGISTKDAQGNMLPMSTLLGNTTSKLLEYKEGAERNIMSNQLLGKSWDEVENIAKLTPQVMADAAKEVRDYHKELDPEAVKRYSEAMSSASGAFEGIQTAIGKAAMPALSELGEWLGSIGPELTDIMVETMKVLSIAFDTVKVAVEICWNNLKTYFGAIGDGLSWCFGTEKLSAMEFFTNCIKVIQVAILGLKSGIEFLAEISKSCFEAIVIGCKQYVSAAASLLKGEGLSGVKAAWDKGTAEIEAVQAASAKRMVAIAEKTRQEIDDAILSTDGNKKSKPAAEKKPGGTKHATTLATDKDKKTGSPSKKSQAKTTNEPPPAQPEQTLNAEIAQLKAQLDNFKLNQNERLRIATDIADKIQQKQNPDPAEVEAAKQKIVEIDRQKEQDLLRQAEETTNKRQAQQLAAIDVAEILAKQEVENGTKTQEQLQAAQREFEKQRYEIAKEGLQRRQTLLDMQGNDKDMVAQHKLLQEKEKLDKDYASKQQIQMSKLQELMGKLKLSGIEIWKEMQNTISTSASDNFQKVLKKTLSFRDAMKNIWNDIGKSFKDMAMKKASDLAVEQGKELASTAATKAKELAISAAIATKELAQAQWLKLKKLFITESAVTEETALKESCSAQQTAISVAEAEQTISLQALKAGAGAAASQASTPIIGPGLAVTAMLTTVGAVMALKGSIASASGGYDIPAGVNPMTQLHEEEMVLPKPYANVIRGMADGGSASGNNTGTSGAAGGGASHTVNYNDHSGRLTRDQIRANARVIADELSKVTKRGWSPT